MPAVTLTAMLLDTLPGPNATVAAPSLDDAAPPLVAVTIVEPAGGDGPLPGVEAGSLAAGSDCVAVRLAGLAGSAGVLLPVAPPLAPPPADVPLPPEVPVTPVALVLSPVADAPPVGVVGVPATAGEPLVPESLASKSWSVPVLLVDAVIWRTAWDAEPGRTRPSVPASLLPMTAVTFACRGAVCDAVCAAAAEELSVAKTLIALPADGAAVGEALDGSGVAGSAGGAVRAVVAGAAGVAGAVGTGRKARSANRCRPGRPARWRTDPSALSMPFFARGACAWVSETTGTRVVRACRTGWAAGAGETWLLRLRQCRERSLPMQRGRSEERERDRRDGEGRKRDCARRHRRLAEGQDDRTDVSESEHDQAEACPPVPDPLEPQCGQAERLFRSD